jgi:hypothetical protein
MKDKIEKLKAHSTHLLAGFLRLRECYAILEPMLFNRCVIQKIGCGKAGQGFKIVK